MNIAGARKVTKKAKAKDEDEDDESSSDYETVEEQFKMKEIKSKAATLPAKVPSSTSIQDSITGRDSPSQTSAATNKAATLGHSQQELIDILEQVSYLQWFYRSMLAFVLPMMPICAITSVISFASGRECMRGRVR